MLIGQFLFLSLAENRFGIRVALTLQVDLAQGYVEIDLLGIGFNQILEDPGVPLLVAVQSTGISDSGSFLEMIRRTVTEWNCDGDRT